MAVKPERVGVLRMDAIARSAGDAMLQRVHLLGRDPPQVVAMVCRTLSIGGVSSIAMPVSVGASSAHRLPIEGCDGLPTPAGQEINSGVQVFFRVSPARS
jgi:hypothetical protein